MATLPTIFLDSILQAAKEHGVEALSLPDNQGLLLLPSGLTASTQQTIMAKMTAMLHPSQTIPEPSAQQEESNQPLTTQLPVNCQVTVEERAQLFKFLTG